VFEEYGSLSGDITFEVRAKLTNIPIKPKKFVIYNFSGSSLLGASFGMVTKVGWYTRIKTNGSFANSEYITTDLSVTNYDGIDYYEYTGNVKRSRFGITGGLVLKTTPKMFLYTGLGYGSRNLLWEVQEKSIASTLDMRKIWAKHDGKSASGLELELGAMFKYNKVNISLGVNAIDLKFFEFNGGIGLFF
jgi:hypothetical protein